MPLDALAGRSYGPVNTRIAAEKVAEYIVATGDDPDRWSAAAPSAYAGALLFAVAPLLVADPDVGASTRVLVHSDQRFAWNRPMRIDAPVTVSGEVAKVRERGSIAFVTFDVSVSDEEGVLVESTSTFLMGSEPAAEPGADPGEPPVEAGGHIATMPVIDSLAAGDALPESSHSASRLDLVRYAAASGDLNPIHFDHDAARAAGLEGVVVHGLLMAAWLARTAAATSTRLDPIAEMKVRFRNLLRPAQPATTTGTVVDVADGRARLDLALRGQATGGEATGGEGIDLVTASATVRR